MQTIKEKIKQRRRQMLVHSYIYYELNDNIVPDSKWAKWAKELEELQKNYPEESASVEYADMFEGWDGSSGAFLKFGEDIKTVANILLSHSEKKSQITIPKQTKVSVKSKKVSSKVSLF